MPRVDLTDAQIGDVAAWLHHFNATGKTVMYHDEINILTGNAKAGETCFQKTCASCHSATGDLAGIGARIAIPRRSSRPGCYPVAKAMALANIPRLLLDCISLCYRYGDFSQWQGRLTGDLVSVSDFYVGLTTEAGGRKVSAETATYPSSKYTIRSLPIASFYRS